MAGDDDFEVVKFRQPGGRCLLKTLKSLDGRHHHCGGYYVGGAAIGLNIMLANRTHREIGVRGGMGPPQKKPSVTSFTERGNLCPGGLGGIVIGILMGNVMSLMLAADFYSVVWIITGVIILYP